MEQRTCNIIMCCKGHCKLPGSESKEPLDAVAAYMSNECGCPASDYRGLLLEKIMEEALFDYMNSADKAGADLRNLFNHSSLEEPTISKRIAVMFQLVNVKDGDTYINGFNEALVNQSKIEIKECEKNDYLGD